MAQARRGHEMSAVTERPVETPSLHVLVPPRTSSRLPGLRALGGVRYVLAYWRLLRRQPMDLLHVHYGCSLGSWLALASGRRPLVVTAMGGDVLVDEQAPHLSRSAVGLTRMVFRHADLVTSKSAMLSRRLLDWGVPQDRILPLMWGVDLRTFRRVDSTPLRRRLGLSDDHQVVLSPRSLRPLYNIETIVEAFAQVVAGSPSAVLVLAWASENESYARHIRKRVDELGLSDRVRWAGIVPAAEMPMLYSLATVMVSVPSSDGMPQCLIEALACETPSVVSDLERYTELIEDGVSALFTPTDAKAVAAAVRRLLLDPELSASLTRRGREIAVACCDLEADLERLDARYAELMRLPPRRRPFVAMRTLALVLGAQIGGQVRDYALRLFATGRRSR